MRLSCSSCCRLLCFNPLHCGAVVASLQTIVSLVAGGICFNPLHCGAVVASFFGVSWAIGCCKGFNPLHCGAVVASRRPVHRPGWTMLVSIPFIAGQWSLPLGSVLVLTLLLLFQSPSLRGSGRFTPTLLALLIPQLYCFNPLHCGAVVASFVLCS